jgi:hypothetical protein
MVNVEVDEDYKYYNVLDGKDLHRESSSHTAGYTRPLQGMDQKKN